MSIHFHSTTAERFNRTMHKWNVPLLSPYQLSFKTFTLVLLFPYNKLSLPHHLCCYPRLPCLCCFFCGQSRGSCSHCCEPGPAVKSIAATREEDRRYASADIGIPLPLPSPQKKPTKTPPIYNQIKTEK